MAKQISRRRFLQKSAVALSTVAACGLEVKSSGGQVTVPGTLSLQQFREREMPHVIVKLYPGRTEQQEIRLAEAIVKDVVVIAKCREKSVSVAIEEIKPEDWMETVYQTDILGNPAKLYKKPG